MRRKNNHPEKRNQIKKQCYKNRKNEVGIWRLQLGAIRLATKVSRNIVGRLFIFFSYRVVGMKNEYKDTN